MSLTFENLATYLPAGVIEFVGNNQLKLNLTLLTGQPLLLESSCVETVTKLMHGLATFTSAINQARLESNPPKQLIKFVEEDLTGTPEKPEYEFKVKVAVQTTQFINNLVDPTAE